jgi:two-component system, OmpR family, sensor histidine kinase TctE
VRITIAASSAILIIADSGGGIPPDLRERLFQPFSAGHAGSGSGLGLAICHEIVVALGGNIALENRIDRGHTAGLDTTVRLPLADNRA